MDKDIDITKPSLENGVRSLQLGKQGRYPFNRISNSSARHRGECQATAQRGRRDLAAIEFRHSGGSTCLGYKDVALARRQIAASSREMQPNNRSFAHEQLPRVVQLLQDL